MTESRGQYLVPGAPKMPLFAAPPHPPPAIHTCIWLGCLDAEQQLRLVDEIGCELLGEVRTEPAEPDQRDACRCAEDADAC